MPINGYKTIQLSRRKSFARSNGLTACRLVRNGTTATFQQQCQDSKVSHEIRLCQISNHFQRGRDRGLPGPRTGMVQKTVPSTPSQEARSVRWRFRVSDWLVLMLYVAVLFWFSDHLLHQIRPSFQNRLPSYRLQQIATVGLSLGAIMTLPQLWLFFATRPDRRKPLVLPVLTVLILGYCSLAAHPLIAAVGVLSVFQAAVIYILKRNDPQLRLCWVLVGQVGILIAVHWSAGWILAD